LADLLAAAFSLRTVAAAALAFFIIATRSTELRELPSIEFSLRCSVDSPEFALLARAPLSSGLKDAHHADDFSLILIDLAAIDSRVIEA